MRDTRYEIRHTRKGMTLIEILVAIAIIGVLLGVAVYVGKAVYEQAKERSLESTFTIFESALDEYKEYDRDGEFPPDAGGGVGDEWLRSEGLYYELNRFPVSRKMLEKLNASLISDSDGDDYPEIYDPWDRVLDYRYDPVVNHYPEIVSAGPNPLIGEDDISSRDK